MRTSSSFFFLVVLLTLACDGASRPGTILVHQGCASATSDELCSVSAQAYFFESAPPVIGCTRTTVASCEVFACEFSGIVRPESVLHNAGTVTIDGLRSGPLSVQFLDGRYMTDSRLARGWLGGETLNVSASGADVPAFSNAQLVAPGDVELTAPACPEGKCGTFSRAADLPIAWNAAAGTSAQVSLMSRGVSRMVNVSCDFATSPGLVPAAAMSRLLDPPPAPQHQGPGIPSVGIGGPWLTVTAKSETAVSAGAWDIRVLALITGSGSSFTLQD